VADFGLVLVGEKENKAGPRQGVVAVKIVDLSGGGGGEHARARTHTHTF